METCKHIYVCLHLHVRTMISGLSEWTVHAAAAAHYTHWACLMGTLALATRPSLLPFRADYPQAFQFNEQTLKSMRSRQRNPESLLMCEVIRMPFQTPPGLTTLAKHKQEKRRALHLRSQASRCFQQLRCWYQNSTSPGPGDTHRVCEVKLRLSKAQPAQAGPLPFLTCQYKLRHSVPGPVSSARNRDVIVLCEAWLSRSRSVLLRSFAKGMARG